jgi:hypothetical protein
VIRHRRSAPHASQLLESFRHTTEHCVVWASSFVQTIEQLAPPQAQGSGSESSQSLPTCVYDAGGPLAAAEGTTSPASARVASVILAAALHGPELWSCKGVVGGIPMRGMSPPQGTTSGRVTVGQRPPPPSPPRVGVA